MTRQELGKAYRDFLFKDGWMTLASNLSDEAAFNLYEELERVGVGYYSDMYNNAYEDLRNGFKESMDKFNKMFYDKSKYFLKLSGKDSEYIEKKCKDFSDKLLSYCASQRVKSIHDLFNKEYASFRDVLDEFGEDEEVKDMSMDEERVVSGEESMEENGISTPLEYMKLIEGTIEYYDGILSSDKLSDDNKKRVESNKENFLLELNSKFAIFLDNYVKGLVDAATVVMSEEDKKKLEEEVSIVVSIYANYFHDEERALEVQREFSNSISENHAADELIEKAVPQDFNPDEIEASEIVENSNAEESMTEVSPVQADIKEDFSNEEINLSEELEIPQDLEDAEIETPSEEVLEDSVQDDKIDVINMQLDGALNVIDNEDLFFKDHDLDDEINYFKEVIDKTELLKKDVVDEAHLNSISEKENLVLNFIDVLEDRKILKVPSQNLSSNEEEVPEIEDITEELDSFDTDDFSNMSNAELSDRVKELISQIEVANLHKDSNLKYLINEAKRAQDEMDRRLSGKSESLATKPSAKHFKTGIDLEADTIRNSKHFTPEVKEQLISELYGEMGDTSNVRAR